MASNLFGRLMSAALADHLGLAVNFYVFALLNLSGALLVYVSLKRTTPMTGASAPRQSPLGSLAEHLRNGPLCASFAIGFLILFTFIGTFTYVNFVLVRQPLGLEPDAAGLRLFRLPALDLHHAACRQGRARGSAPARPSGPRSLSPESACPCC